MLAFEIRQPGDYGLIELGIPEPVPGEVLVRVAACGICGSDVDLIEGRRPSSVTRYPVIPGHEFCGEIVDVGESVSSSRIGERVVVDAMVAPPTCDNCRKGWVCHCRDGYNQLGFTRPGGMAEFVAVPAGQAWTMDPQLSWEAAALVEPASCAAHGMAKADLQPGCNVVIVGAGPIGALAIRLARLHDPERIIMVEKDSGKLSGHAELGATHSVDANHDPVAESVLEITNGYGADAIIECSGSLAAIHECFRYAGTKARIVLIGIPGTRSLEVDYLAMLSNDLTMAVSNGYTTDVWRQTMALLAGGKLDTSRIVTHRQPLSAVPKAFEALRNRSESITKMLLLPGLNGEEARR